MTGLKPNKAVLSPSAGTAIPLALHVSPKPRRYEKGMNQPSGLISALLDPSADDASRDDAAMDLSEFDQAEEALFKAALLPEMSDIVRASCGESLAEIWLRAGAVNRKYYDALPSTAQIAARNYIYAKNPDLLKS